MQKKVKVFCASFFVFVSLFVVLQTQKVWAAPQDITPPDATGCDPKQGGIDLTDCFLLNSQGQKVKDVYSTPTEIVNRIVPILFVVSGIILFFLIIYAGFLFITGEVKGKDKALELGKTAVIGFLVMFCAYWIVQIIKLITGANILL